MDKDSIDLLFVDLCARLPYGIICRINGRDELINGIDPFDYVDSVLYNAYNSSCNIEDAKPYLRPMSSMTEEEKEELFKLCVFSENEDWEGRKTEMYCITVAERFDPVHSYDTSFKFWGINMNAIDWLNANHFDYRGLIEKGLAITVTKENNPYKD